MNEAQTIEAPTTSRLIWRGIFVAIPLLFIALLAWRLWETNVSEQRADGSAPDFAFVTFDGEPVSLADFEGKGIVLNFWASWCTPCREEAALLEETWREEKENGIVFLGLDYLDQEPAALRYLEEFDITYPNGPDLRSEVARRYKIKGVPETFFIDPSGQIREIVVGPIVNRQQFAEYLDKIRPLDVNR